MLNEFVEKILVHERARKGSQDTTQEIEIYFNFLGRYIPPSLQPVPLTPEEQEELRKKEERKDRLHQNYLKRKASGAQKQYAGGAKSCGTAPQGRRPTGPTGTGQAPRPGAGAVKGTALCRPLSGASRFTTPFCTQKNRRTGFPIRRQMVYLPNKSLCDPVRASVSTSTSSSIR